MKKVTLILLVIITAALVLAACGGDDDKDTEKVAKDVMKALEKYDAEKITEKFCEGAAGVDEATRNAYFGEGELKFESMKYKEQNKKDNNADVEVTGKVKEPAKDIALTFKVAKPDKNWCVMSIEGLAAAPMDEGTTDEGTMDEGTTDEGTTDEGTTDEGTTDEGTTDEGTTDEGGAEG